MFVVPKVKLIRRSGVEVFSVYFTFPMGVESAITKMTLVGEFRLFSGFVKVCFMTFTILRIPFALCAIYPQRLTGPSIFGFSVLDWHVV